MKTTWNDRQGNRDRKARCLIVTEDGACHPFSGESIPGVCHAQRVSFEKNGKWSNSTWEIEHRPSTSVVTWDDDWDTGRTWPQASWAEGLLWLAEKAPSANMEKFREAQRAWAAEKAKHAGAWSQPPGLFPSAAERWDAAEKAVSEFAESRPVTGGADVAELRAQIEKERGQQAEIREKITAEKELAKERQFTVGLWDELDKLKV